MREEVTGTNRLVTQITEIAKGRCRIYIEEEPVFVLYRGEIRQLGIREGEAVSEKSMREIREEILPGRAKRRAMNLLQSRDYTEAGLREKLKGGDYPEHCIEEALAYVKAYGYVNDRRYAGDYITCYLNRKSRMRIEQDLMRKGIAKEVISAVFDELEEQGTGQDEDAVIHSLLEKRKYDPKTATRQEKQRMYAFLYRRGFHSEAINRALLLDIT